MARLPEDAAAGYVAGLLCDVGQLVLTVGAPERQYVTEAEAAQRGVPQHVAELSTWGATHAEIGAYLLGLWGLPVQIVQAVADHHAPARAASDHFGLAQLVWLASCIVDDEELGVVGVVRCPRRAIGPGDEAEERQRRREDESAGDGHQLDSSLDDSACPS